MSGQPTEQQLEEIEALKDSQIHVHSIYNARVTAFFCRYAKLGRGGSEVEAFAMMEAIWPPGNNWADFIENEDPVGK